MLEQTILMIQIHFLSVELEWMTFIRILMTTTQVDKEKFELCLITRSQTL